MYQYNAAGTLARVYQVAGGVKYLVYSVSMGVLPLDTNLSLPIGGHAAGIAARDFGGPLMAEV